MKNLGTLSQQVWAATTIEQKKLLLNEMVDSFKYKAKAASFRQSIEQTNLISRLDSIVQCLL